MEQQTCGYLVPVFVGAYTLKVPDLEMPQHVMLSYQWDHQDPVKRIHHHLRHDGLPVWMDIEGMTGDINDSVAAGVEEALAVCPFMTPADQESLSSKKELTHADSRGVTIIAIMLAEYWEASKWLALITAGLLWLDFRASAGREGWVFRHARSDVFIQVSGDQVTGFRVQLTVLLGDRGHFEVVKGRGCTHLRNMSTRRFLWFDCEQSEVRSEESPSQMSGLSG